MSKIKPLIVVVNGTADEGYWTTHYLLKTGRFRVRATVRRTEGERVQRLKTINFGGETCEIVKAATSDKQALNNAFEGAQGIYGTSIYNIHARKYYAANPEEMAQCHALISAAKECKSLEHIVWQTMTRFDIDPRELGLEAPIHFRTKWFYEDVIRDANLPWTFVRQPAYMRQIGFGMQFKNRLVYPYDKDARLAYVAEEDLGKIVAAIFSDRESHMKKAFNGVSEIITPTEIAERAHKINPRFKPTYRQATWAENAVFDYIIVSLNPSYRYPMQINRNIMAGNYFQMTLEDKENCERLIYPLILCKAEDWMTENFKNKGWM